MLGVGVVEGTARVDTGGGREGGPIDDVGEELTVNGIGDHRRTSTLERSSSARLNSSHWIGPTATVSGDDHVVVVLQADDVGGAAGRREVGVAVLQAEDDCRGVGNDLDDDLVEVRTLGMKKSSNASRRMIEPASYSARVTGPDRRSSRFQRCRVFNLLAVVVDVLGDDRKQTGRHREKDRRVRFAEVDDHRGSSGVSMVSTAANTS